MNSSAIEEATAFVRQCLEECRFPQRESVKATLVTEEAVGSLVLYGTETGKIRISVRIFLGTVTIDMSAPGAEYNLTEAMASATLPGEVGELGYEAQEVISNILLRTVAEDLKYRHKEPVRISGRLS